MANTNSPFGLLTFGRRDGGSPTAGLTRVWIASSDANPVFNGDLVAYSSANTNYVTWASTGAGGVGVRGVFYGCEYYSPSVGRVVWSRYFPGAVQTGGPDVTAYIVDDPDQLFIVQSSSQAVTTAMIGQNFAVIPSSEGNTTTGQSNLTLATSVSLGSTNSTYPVRLVDLYSNYAPPGAQGVEASGYNIAVVAPNAWDRKVLTGATT